MTTQDIIEMQHELGVSYGVANELMLLAGGDKDLVRDASDASAGLNECKANIINARFIDLERN